MNLALVLARKGSKRLKNKNLLKIQGKNLIQLAAMQALKTNIFKKIIISTDIKNIENFFSFLKKKDFNKIIFLKRPKKLATDHARVPDVILDILKKINIKNFKTFTLLQPTSPLRRSKDILGGFKMLNKKVTGVISVCESKFTNQYYFNISKHKDLKPVIQHSNPNKSHLFLKYDQKIYEPNGIFYTLWINKFLKNKDFFKEKIKAYIIPRNRSIDIDYLEDLIIARKFYRKVFKS